MNITLRPARPADAEEMTRWFADEADLAQWARQDIDFPLTARRLYDCAGFLVERWYSIDSTSRPRPEWMKRQSAGAAVA